MCGHFGFYGLSRVCYIACPLPRGTRSSRSISALNLGCHILKILCPSSRLDAGMFPYDPSGKRSRRQNPPPERLGCRHALGGEHMLGRPRTFLCSSPYTTR